MDFAIKVALSFIVGGSYISFIVWSAEKLGTKIGSAIAGTPSTLLVALGFISITEGAAAARNATAIIPILLVVALFYAYVFVTLGAYPSLYSRHFLISAISTFLWMILGTLVRSAFAGLPFWLIVAVASAGIVIFGILFRNFPNAAPNKLSTNRRTYVLRFVAAGTVVSSAVLLARVLGPTWGGLVASFPAAFATSLYFLNKSQANRFTKGFAKRLPFGVISTFIFIVLLYVTLTNLPIVLAFFIALTGALAYTLLLAFSKPRAVSNRK